MLYDQHNKTSRFYIVRKTRLKILSLFILSTFVLSILVGMIFATGLIAPILSSIFGLNRSSTPGGRSYYVEQVNYYVDPNGNLTISATFQSDQPFIAELNDSLSAYDRAMYISFIIFNESSSIHENYKNNPSVNNDSIGELVLTCGFPAPLQLLKSELLSYGEMIAEDWNQIFNLNSTGSELNYSHMVSDWNNGLELDIIHLIFTANLSTERNYTYFLNFLNSSLPNGLNSLVLNDNMYSRDGILEVFHANIDLFEEYISSITFDPYFENQIRVMQKLPEYYTPYNSTDNRTLNVGTISGVSSIKSCNETEYATNIASSIYTYIQNSYYYNSSPDVMSESYISFINDVEVYYNLTGQPALNEIELNFTAPQVYIERTQPITDEIGDLEYIELNINNNTDLISVYGEIYSYNDFHSYIPNSKDNPNPILDIYFENTSPNNWTANLTSYIIPNGKYVLVVKGIYSDLVSYGEPLLACGGVLGMGLLVDDINITNSDNMLFDFEDPLNNTVVSLKADGSLDFAVNISNPYTIEHAWATVTNQFGKEEQPTKFSDLYQFHDFTTNNLMLVSGIIVDINNDGYDDVLGARDQMGMYREISLYLNDGTGDFEDPTTIIINSLITPNDIAVGDFNNDTLPDFVVLYSDMSSNHYLEFWLNNISEPGSFSFWANITGLPNTPYYVVSADFDQNDYDDIICSDTSQNVFLFLNNGTTFNYDSDVFGSPYGDGSQAPLAVGDFNNDSYTDIAIQHGSSADLWINDGIANFTYWNNVIPSDDNTPSTMGSGDLNMDGVPDLLFGYNGGYIHAMIYSDGSFIQQSNIANINDEISGYGNMGITNLDASGDLNNDTINDVLACSFAESRGLRNLGIISNEHVIDLAYDAGSGFWNGSLNLEGLTWGNQSVKIFAEDIYQAVGSSNSTLNFYINNSYIEDSLNIIIFDGGVSVRSQVIGSELYVDVNTSIPELDGVQCILFIAYNDNQSTEYDHRLITGGFFEAPPRDVHIFVFYENVFNTMIYGPDYTGSEMADRAGAIENEIERVFNTGTEIELLQIQDQNGTSMFSNMNYMIFGMNYTGTFNFSSFQDDFFNNYAKDSNLMNVLKDSKINESDAALEIVWNRPGFETFNPNQYLMGSDMFPVYDTGNVVLISVADFYDSYWLHDNAGDKEFSLAQVLNKTPSSLIGKPDSMADYVKSSLMFQCVNDYADLMSYLPMPIAEYTGFIPDNNLTLQNNNMSIVYNVWDLDNGLNSSNDIEVNLTVPMIQIDCVLPSFVAGNVSISANITSANGVDNSSVQAVISSPSSIGVMGQVSGETYQTINLIYNDGSKLYEGWFDSIACCPNGEIEIKITAKDSLVLGLNQYMQNVSYTRSKMVKTNINNTFYAEKIRSIVDPQGNILISGQFGGYNLTSGINITSAFDNVRVDLMAANDNDSKIMRNVWEDEFAFGANTPNTDDQDVLLIISGENLYNESEWDLKATEIKIEYEKAFGMEGNFTLISNFTNRHFKFIIFACNYSVIDYTTFINKFQNDVPGGLANAFDTSRLTTNLSYLCWKYDFQQFWKGTPASPDFYNETGERSAYYPTVDIFPFDPNVGSEIGHEVITANIYLPLYFGSNYNSTTNNYTLDYANVLTMPFNVTDCETTSLYGYVETIIQNANITSVSADGFASLITQNNNTGIYNGHQSFMAYKNIKHEQQSDTMFYDIRMDMTYCQVNFTAILFDISLSEPTGTVGDVFQITVFENDYMGICDPNNLYINAYIFEKNFFENLTNSLSWTLAETFDRANLMYNGTYFTGQYAGYNLPDGEYKILIAIEGHNDQYNKYPTIIYYETFDFTLASVNSSSIEIVSPVTGELSGMVEFKINGSSPNPILAAFIWLFDNTGFEQLASIPLTYNGSSYYWEAQWPSYDLPNQNILVYAGIIDMYGAKLTELIGYINNTEFIEVSIIPYDPYGYYSYYGYYYISGNYPITAPASGPNVIVEGIYEILDASNMNLVYNGTLVDPDSTWMGMFDSNQVSDGFYYLRVTITDIYGAKASDQIYISINNGGGTGGEVDVEFLNWLVY
ncbi:MAG: VCBS repeat-containing protein, partial [Candidatus Lokiarchaeota archaeon]|nr:VCBS repeat-containing protein [Candidatus Lokiarchaeota archaeon]